MTDGWWLEQSWHIKFTNQQIGDNISVSNTTNLRTKTCVLQNESFCQEYLESEFLGRNGLTGSYFT